MSVQTRTGISDAFAEGLVAAARTAGGEDLRSVVYVTPDAFDLLYLRGDLYLGDHERAREVKTELVDIERDEFDTAAALSRLSAEEDTEPQIGDYEHTIRVFSEGFVSRVFVGDHGVLLTTDEIDLDRFEELAIALRGMLADDGAAA
jgi:hypothetical protein